MSAAQPRLGRLARTVVYLPVTGSTNDVAAQLIDAGGCEGAVVVAETQTAGRGRLRRAWYSPPGSGLYVSIVLAPGQARSDRANRATRLTTLAAGVALAEAVEWASFLHATLKWPNDLYAGGRKLGGILAEATAPGTTGEVVLGFGINVGAAAYPPELRDRATSLESELGREVDRGPLFAESLVALDRRYDDLLAGRFDAILDAWRALAPASTGGRVAWPTASGPLSGTTAGIDRDGALLVDVGDRIERIVGGEVSWL